MPLSSNKHNAIRSGALDRQRRLFETSGFETKRVVGERVSTSGVLLTTIKLTYAILACWLMLTALVATAASGQGLIAAPDRESGEGLGPFDKLVITNAIIIDGTGGPPRGPLSIVIKGNRIDSITRRSEFDDADHVIDAEGMYVLPGFVDMHAHAGSAPKAPEVEYVYKLWLAHGVTTVRGVPLGPNDWTVREKERSANNEIVAPRIFNYQRPGAIRTIEEAQDWVRRAPSRGIDGLKLGAYPPEIMEALLTEANRLGLGSTAHLAQTGVAQMNAIDAARLGLGTVTHFYGHFESLLREHVVQPYPVDHNYNNEQDRFSQVARLWNQIHPPGSEPWQAYLREHLELGTTFDPTMTIYAAGRDVMRARNAEWHDQYTLPSLFQFFEPSLANHGSYWFDWTTWDEVAWRNFYHVWMQLINDYKKMGGRVTVGSDSGFIYKTYGFGYIEELELLQEAGFHPLEVIQSATMNGALTLHEPGNKPLEFGIIREGLLADLIVVPENPIANLKVLYATGAIRLNEESGEVERVGGVDWTIKDGIVYDAKALLADVADMVDEQKAALAARQNGRTTPTAPQATAPVEPPVTNSNGIESHATESNATESNAAELEVADSSPGSDTDTEPSANTETVTQIVENNAESRDANTNNSLTDEQTSSPTVFAEAPFRGDVIVVTNDDQSQVFAYTKQHGRWYGLETGQDAEATVEPVLGERVAWVILNERIHAFGADEPGWQSLQTEEPIQAEQVTTHADLIMVRTPLKMHIFSAESGKWGSVSLSARGGE